MIFDMGVNYMSLLLNTFMVPDWVTNLVNWLKTFVVPILIVVAAVAAFYAIYVGVKLATAENADARQEAQKKLIYIIIALVVTIIMVILLFSLPNILEKVVDTDKNVLG